jgi:gas vesicle protein
METVEVRMSRTNWQGTTSGIIIGVGIGVALGMILSTKAGQEAREQIVGNVKKGLNRALENGQDLTERVQDKLSDVREQAKRAADAGEQFYRDARSGNL